jgi:uncharacterized membrane protein HdeD (DUF308 family)
MAQIGDNVETGPDRRARLRSRLDTAGWGLLLAWSGALILVPGELDVLWNVWLVGVGAIVVGVAAVAVRLRSRPGWDTWILGIVALSSGLAGLVGISVSVIGLGLLLFGLAFLLRVVRATVGDEPSRTRPRSA